MPPLNFLKVAEILQNEFGVTTADEPKSTLVTYGLVNCVGIAGYSADVRASFVAHYQHNTDIPDAIGALLYHLDRVARGTPATFEVRMKGGVRGMSEHLVAALLSRLAMPLREDIRLVFDGNEADLLQAGVRGVDLGVSAETGKFIEAYNPLDNPFHREPPSALIKDVIFANPYVLPHYLPEL